MMDKKIKMLVGALAVVIALGLFGYWYVLREPEAPSAPIEAIQLEPIETEVVIEVTSEELNEEPAEEATEEPAEVVEAVAEEVVAEEVIEEDPTAEPEPTEVPSNPVTWEIVSDQSTARFELDEDLNGERITVIGVADQVAGQMRFDPADLSTAQIGIIQTNARTFVTDKNNRNKAIQNRILQTGDYEFITFEPTGISGMPDSAAVGDTVEFTVDGNLTIRDVTNAVTFSAIVDFIDGGTLEGTVATIVAYSDFGISIPQLDFIANVEEELEIYVDFVAAPIDGVPVEGEAEAGTASEAADEAVAAGSTVTWEINSDESTARFELDEDLNGERITVVGVADQVAGQMRFDPADLSTADIGIIQVNARTFATDNDRRNRAIQNRILQTGEYEFVTFEPTAIIDMPASAAVGDTIQFDIEGNLTVRDVTLPVVFSAVVDFVDINTIEGTVATIFTYSDFGINVPQVPVIANVEEELEIYIDFYASPTE